MLAALQCQGRCCPQRKLWCHAAQMARRGRNMVGIWRSPWPLRSIVDGCEIPITSWKRWFIPYIYRLSTILSVAQDFATIRPLLIDIDWYFCIDLNHRLGAEEGSMTNEWGLITQEWFWLRSLDGLNFGGFLEATSCLERCSQLKHCRRSSKCTMWA